ncbi:MAG: hypothetical protein R3F14_16025 [Polyangiaceae bacterium]
MRAGSTLLVTLLLTAAVCTSCAESADSPSPPPAPTRTASLGTTTPSSAATSTLSATTSTEPAAAPSPALAPAPAPVPTAIFGAAAPIRIAGYPGLVGSGFAAVALAAGFTSDGAAVGVCFNSGGADTATCRFQDRAGAEQAIDVPMTFPPGEPERLDPPSAARGMPMLRRVGPAAYDYEAPPLTGTWAFGRDIVLHVAEIKGESNGVAAPRLRFGGSVRGRAAVFPIEIQRPPVDSVPSDVHFIRPNAVALSPDGQDLGLVVHSAVGEYDSTYTLHRIPARTLAARIYAMTAGNARGAGDIAASRSLCALAVAADARAAAETCEP